MKNILLTLILIFGITLNSFAQESETYYEEITGTGTANGGEYDYEATLEAKIYNSGLGGIALKIGIKEYKITSFTYKEELFHTIDEGFPIEINNIQSDLVDGYLNIKSATGHYSVATQNFSLLGVRKGHIDNVELDNENIKSIKNYNNGDPVSFVDFYLEFSGQLKNTYFEELSKIASSYNQKKLKEQQDNYLAEQKEKAQETLKEIEIAQERDRKIAQDKIKEIDIKQERDKLNKTIIKGIADINNTLKNYKEEKEALKEKQLQNKINSYANGYGSLDENGKKIGLWEYGNPINGNIKRRGEYENEKKTGDWEYFDDKGNLIEIVTYENGQQINSYKVEKVVNEQIGLSGILQSGYRVKNVKGESWFVGDYSTKNVNNVCLKRGGYDTKGNIHGKWIINFDRKQSWLDEGGFVEKEHKKAVENFKNGVSHGKFIKYYWSGNIKQEGSYEEGQVNGNIINYYDNRKKKSIIPYLNGVITGKYYKFYENGNIKEEGHYKNELVDGLFKEYYESGGIVREGYYKNGKRDGEWSFYHENGNIGIKNAKYRLGEKIGVWEQYDKKGKLLRTLKF